jgi:hypothetical protein
MVLTYCCFQGYHWLQRRNKTLRQKLIKEQQNRFNEQRRELQRQVSDIEMSSKNRQEKEIKYNGLVIIRAILGEKGETKDAAQKTRKLKMPKEGTLAEKVEQLEQRIHEMRLLDEDFGQELADLTALVQNEVSGGQLIDYDLEKLRHLNPALTDTVRPWLLLVYLERGQLKQEVVECRGKLWLGGIRSSGLLKRSWRRLTGLFKSC